MAKARGDKRGGGDKPAPPQEGVKGQVDGWTTSASRYLKAVRAEMKRITWPNREQLRAYTLVVLLTLIFVTTYLALCDWVFTAIFKKLVGS